jgi:hypothetical protein
MRHHDGFRAALGALTVIAMIVMAFAVMINASASGISDPDLAHHASEGGRKAA